MTLFAGSLYGSTATTPEGNVVGAVGTVVSGLNGTLWIKTTGVGNTGWTQLQSGVANYANLAAFPATGTTGIIYVDNATGIIYRWDGAAYQALSTTISRLSGTAVYDPPSLVPGSDTSTTVTVTGAAIGDSVTFLSFSLALSGIQIKGEVTAANTVTVYFKNFTNTTVDLASGTLRVKTESY